MILGVAQQPTACDHRQGHGTRRIAIKQPAAHIDLPDQCVDRTGLRAPRISNADRPIMEAFAICDFQGPVIAECAAAAPGPEHLVMDRVVDDANLGAAIMDACQNHGPDRNACDEIGGAINRVDDPSEAGCACRRGVFLADDAVVGEGGGQRGTDFQFDVAVCLGHQILVALALNREVLEGAKIAKRGRAAGLADIFCGGQSGRNRVRHKGAFLSVSATLTHPFTEQSNLRQSLHRAACIPPRCSVRCAPMLCRLILLCSLLLIPLRAADAGEVTVAVAANFLTTAKGLAPAFEAETGHRVLLAGGSTGRHAALIAAGAPFDVFLSADTARAEALLASGKAVDVRPYAVGRLVLVGPADMPKDWPRALAKAAQNPIAIANPALAPYGVAATEALEAAGLTIDNLITGDSVGQVAAFLATGNVRYGLLALAQVQDGLAEDPQFSFVEAPADEESLVQSAALLSDNPTARAYFNWITGPSAAPTIEAAGYHLPRPDQ